MLMLRVPILLLSSYILLYVLQFASATDSNLQWMIGSFCSRNGGNLHSADSIIGLHAKQICCSEYQHIRGNTQFSPIPPLQLYGGNDD